MFPIPTLHNKKKFGQFWDKKTLADFSNFSPKFFGPKLAEIYHFFFSKVGIGNKLYFIKMFHFLLKKFRLFSEVPRRRETLLCFSKILIGPHLELTSVCKTNQRPVLWLPPVFLPQIYLFVILFRIALLLQWHSWHWEDMSRPFILSEKSINLPSFFRKIFDRFEKNITTYRLLL